MALLNYMAKGTYSIIDGIHYSKQDRWLRFFLKIYTDADKKVELASRFFDFNGNQYIREIVDICQEPPANIIPDVYYIVKPNGLNEWYERDNLFASFESKYQDWGFGIISPSELLYNKDIGYFHYHEANVITMYPTCCDTRTWDKWFSEKLVFSSETNLYMQIYRYLRTLKGFEGTVHG